MKKYLSCLVLTCLPAIGMATNAHTGMVVSEQRLASQVGADILKAGGNAVDAAVAVGYALSVVNSCCGNIGGGGFMNIHFADGKNVFLNFREKAPLKASKKMYLDAKGHVIPGKSREGYLAVAIPGTVLGLDTALKKYGTMTRQQVMAPAIKLAEEGYIISEKEARWFAESADDFKTQPNVAAIFLKQGNPYQAGERLVQKNLGGTLRLIAKSGPEVFYKGSIAHAIVKASNAHSGILSLADFANYTVQTLKPITCHYRGYTILSAPPPSSGGIALCETLNILENLPLREYGYESAITKRYIIEAMRQTFIDRNNSLGDPDFIKNPVDRLLSKSYAKSISETISSSDRAPLNDAAPLQHELTDTTHYSVVDKSGNAVAVTYTLNGFFGAGVIAGDTGFFLNDEMDDFSANPGSVNQFNLLQGEANAIAPGKRPLSSMTPTIVLNNGRLFMVLGSPGGPRIITATLLTMLNVIDFDMSLQAAVDAPRIHYQASPDDVFVEPFALSFLNARWLEWRGYHIVPQSTWSAVEAIMVNDDGSLIGVNDDVRRPIGSAVGS
jgi:gamma-glutamyltranspeptidase/glutathione hydrolase